MNDYKKIRIIEMKEKYSLFEYELFDNDGKWDYKIYCDRDYLNQCKDTESEE